MSVYQLIYFVIFFIKFQLLEILNLFAGKFFRKITGKHLYLNDDFSINQIYSGLFNSNIIFFNVKVTVKK